MSYDLYFRAGAQRTAITFAEFSDYFSQRPHYEVSDSQAWYTNDETGVYFVFEFNDSAEVEAQDDEPLLPVTFNMNYLRPHSFGIEAEPEVKSFVTAFGLLVCDPQNLGMGEGAYSTEGFLRGWNAGNEFGFRAMFSQEPDADRPTLPTAAIEFCWRWNYEREARQTEIGENAFVPKVAFIHRDSGVATAAIWGDGIPSLLPEVDLLIVPRQQLAPARRFSSSKEDIVVLEWRQMEHLFKAFPRSMHSLACYELFYESIPADIEQMIRAAKPPAVPPVGLRFDQVLNQELMEANRPAR